MTRSLSSIKDISKVQLAKTNSESVTTTIPEEIRKAAGITKGTRLLWDYDTKSGKITVTKLPI